MFEIFFLGTSASAPSAHRGLPAQIVQHNEYRFLVDCGEGTQRQIMQSGIGFKNLHRILLTHSHLDHILGLGGLMSTFLRWETIEHLEIYGSPATIERARKLIDEVVLIGKKTPMPLTWHEIRPGLVFDGGDFSVSAFEVSHRHQSLGYLFEEKARRPFLATRADALGVPFGPERRELVAGNPITLADGRVIDPEEVLGDWIPGVKVVITGDTGRTDNLLEVCRNADALVIESTYMQEELEMARQFAHLTARDAAELARDAGVKRLILTHISRRYRGKDMLAEAQAVFPGAVVARDFDHVVIKRDE
jgi:ribonuclease Z